MNRIRSGLHADVVLASWPPPRADRVLVEALRCFAPADFVASGRRSAASRVLADYPGSGAKLVNYVLGEGLAATLEKTRAKLDQKRVATDLALSAVGVVAAAPEGSGLTAGDVVACGGFLLPVEADAYLLHPDQCTRVPCDATLLHAHFWLGALIELARRLAASGARSVEGIALGTLAGPFDAWLQEAGLAAPTGRSAEAAVAGAARFEASGGPARGFVLDASGAGLPVADGWHVARLPQAGTFRGSPLDPRPLEWPFPFGPDGREAARDILLRGQETPRAAPPAARPRRVDLGGDVPAAGELGLSIVGCGNFARAVLLFHARRIEGVRLRGLCDIRPEVAAVTARSLRAAFHTADYAAILDDPHTHAILVASDHGSHAEHAARALEAGKAVHVEKPPAVSPAQLTTLLEALARTGGVLTVGYNRPFAPAYPVLMEALASESGPVAISMTVKGFKLPREHWYYWPDQGTRLAGNLVHWIDLGYRAAGATRPLSVHVARDRSRHPADASDIAVIAMRFEDGSVASIHFTTAGDDLRGVREWIEIGRGGTSVRLEDFARLEIVRGVHRVTRRFGRDRGHAAEIRDVVLRLRRRERDPEGVRAMVATSAILFAAQRSFDSGDEEPVEILDRWRELLD